MPSNVIPTSSPRGYSVIVLVDVPVYPVVKVVVERPEYGVSINTVPTRPVPEGASVNVAPAFAPNAIPLIIVT